MAIQITLFLTNIILINAVFLLSFFVRYGTNIPDFNFDPYKDNFIFLTIMHMLALVFAKVYKIRFKSFWDLFKSVFSGLFIGTLFCITLVYVFRDKWARFPSSIFIISAAIGVLVIYTFNALVLGLTHRIKKKVIFIGKENNGDILEESPLVEKTQIDKIEELLQHDDIDEIVICELTHDEKQLNLLIYLLLKLQINVTFSPSIYAKLLSENVMEENSIRFLATFIGRKSDCEEFMIRAMDIFISSLAIIFLSPLMGFTCLLIKITSDGPVFYKQIRVGKDGKIFTLYKFKTMVNNAEQQTGPILATENDPRATKVGLFLRTIRFDELPQLLNVIRGEMSLVGPRPERPHFVKLHKALREIRLAVKPGLTGFAQIRSYYSLHPKHKIKYDYLYIQRRSLFLNLYIMAKTIPIILSKKGR